MKDLGWDRSSMKDPVVYTFENVQKHQCSYKEDYPALRRHKVTGGTQANKDQYVIECSGCQNVWLHEQCAMLHFEDLIKQGSATREMWGPPLQDKCAECMQRSISNSANMSTSDKPGAVRHMLGGGWKRAGTLQAVMVWHVIGSGEGSGDTSEEGGGGTESVQGSKERTAHHGSSSSTASKGSSTTCQGRSKERAGNSEGAEAREGGRENSQRGSKGSAGNNEGSGGGAQTHEPGTKRQRLGDRKEADTMKKLHCEWEANGCHGAMSNSGQTPSSNGGGGGGSSSNGDGGGDSSSNGVAVGDSSSSSSKKTSVSGQQGGSRSSNDGGSPASEEHMLTNIAAYQSSQEFLQSAQSIVNGIMNEIFELHGRDQQKAIFHQRIKHAFGHLNLPHLDDSVWEAMPTTSDQRVLEEQKRKQRVNLLKALDEGLQQVANQCFKPQQPDGGGVGGSSNGVEHGAVDVADGAGKCQPTSVHGQPQHSNQSNHGNHTLWST